MRGVHMATIQQPFERKLDALSVRAARACVDIGLHGVEARVIAAFDMNPDMAPRYRSGFVHELATATLALALRLDDDGIVPVWTFGRDAYFQGDMARRDHVSFISRRILPPPPTGSGRRPAPSNFAPLIHRIGQHLFGNAWTPDDAPPSRSPVALPAFVIIYTGGDCGDVADTEAALRYASHFPIFWQFAGVPPEDPATASWAFLSSIDTLSGTRNDCCGFFRSNDYGDMEAIFAGLLNEFPAWLTLPDIRAVIDARDAARSPVSSGDALDDLLALPADEEARRERERIERDERRAARAIDDVHRSNAWPVVGGTEPTPDRSHEGQTRTRMLAPSQWRLEAIREKPWSGEQNSAAETAPSTSTSTDDDKTQPTETAAERLARIRVRRLERRTPAGGSGNPRDKS